VLTPGRTVVVAVADAAAEVVECTLRLPALQNRPRRTHNAVAEAAAVVVVVAEAVGVDMPALQQVAAVAGIVAAGHMVLTCQEVLEDILLGGWTVAVVLVVAAAAAAGAGVQHTVRMEWDDMQVLEAEETLA